MATFLAGLVAITTRIASKWPAEKRIGFDLFTLRRKILLAHNPPNDRLAICAEGIMLSDRYVSYLRVSTDKQGNTGLGLEAQREAVTQFLNSGRG